MEARQARAADWEVLRQLRLRALADAPDAFATCVAIASISAGDRQS